MNASLSCDPATRPSNAERYVAGRMTLAEAEAFEDHFVTCADCQREVRFASSVAVGLSSLPARSANKAPRRWIWTGGGLALAAGLATIMILKSRPPRDIVALGALREAPAYAGVPVRADGARPDSLFDAGMSAYTRHEYAMAAASFRAAVAADTNAVPAQFLLAASLLLDGHDRDAVDAFQRVIDRGESGYRGEARYYRAKALLRLGRAVDAQAELANLSAADGGTFELGRALADSIARARNR